MLSKMASSFVFNLLFFVVVCGLFGVAKSLWKDKKFFFAIIVGIITFFVACGFLIYKGHDMNKKTQEYKSEVHKTTPTDKNETFKNDVNYSEKEIPKKTFSEKTLGATVSDAPKPIKYVSGMQPIRDNSGFYIEFDKALSSDDGEFLFDYVDSKNENELRISVTNLNTPELEATFESMTETQRKEIMSSIKKANDAYASQVGGEITYVGDGYFKVNGNIVLWLTAVIKNSDLISQTAFSYYVAKNKKIYTLQYFTIDSINSLPNDTILTSLNTLRFE